MRRSQSSAASGSDSNQKIFISSRLEVVDQPFGKFTNHADDPIGVHSMPWSYSRCTWAADIASQCIKNCGVQIVMTIILYID